MTDGDDDDGGDADVAMHPGHAPEAAGNDAAAGQDARRTGGSATTRPAAAIPILADVRRGVEDLAKEIFGGGSVKPSRASDDVWEPPMSDM
jgi:hypothetical protein